jgi:trans-AT polyketide synthase, acyltransferase and oxidoreductase domains
MKAILFPGQGAQFKGMGRDLFHSYKELTQTASEILGYSIEKLCTDDPENKLWLTQFTQPALYVVNAFGYYRKREESGFDIDFAAGHSLGEYNALLAADAYNFETGLRLVQKRGDLMGAAKGGAMAAIVGVQADEVKQILNTHRLTTIDLANFNTPTQVVIAGPKDAVFAVEKICSSKDIRCVILNVSAPFHSRYMKEVQDVFDQFLVGFKFNEPKIPVIANTTARPYQPGSLAKILASQISSSVLWTDSVRYLMGKKCTQFIEIGGPVLTKMVEEIRRTQTPIVIEEPPSIITDAMRVPADKGDQPRDATTSSPFSTVSSDMAMNAGNETPHGEAGRSHPGPVGKVTPELLGSDVFRKRFGLRYAYVAGGMYRGIASPKLVVRMGKAGFLGFYGTGGLPLTEIEKGIQFIQAELKNGEPYGLNLLANYSNPSAEKETVKLYLQYNVRLVEAAAFMQMTQAIVLYRLKGLMKGGDGRVFCRNRVIAKVSRPEVAEAFMRPAPTHIVQQLLSEESITEEQAEWSKHLPMSHDICVEADSGGHTDGGIPSVLFPAMLQLNRTMTKKYAYQEPICMGLAGGIGTPDAAAAAFVMGADFILTGSINQCTVEASTSDDVKALLQDINVQDTEYAPAGDMFEMGAKVQVLKKGVFFPSRANKLFSLYSHHNSLDEIPEKTQKQLQTNYFKKTFSEIWSETKRYLEQQGHLHEIAKAEANAKHKMALVFRWYFAYTTRLALEGKSDDRVNYQIHTGPALGAFNQWVKGTELEFWKNRHVDEIGKRLLVETAEYLNNSLARLIGGEAA